MLISLQILYIRKTDGFFNSSFYLSSYTVRISQGGLISPMLYSLCIAMGFIEQESDVHRIVGFATKKFSRKTDGYLSSVY